MFCRFSAYITLWEKADLGEVPPSFYGDRNWADEAVPLFMPENAITGHLFRLEDF